MKFSIITPTHNMGAWITQTIESVISQEGDFSIEYIVVDGGSDDDTELIIRTYIEQIAEKKYQIRCNDVSIRYISQIGTGMYDAINQGFSLGSGDIYAWLNADDLYQADSLKSVASVFAAYPQIELLKGTTTTINEQGHIIKKGGCRVYRQDWLTQGLYGRGAYFVEQDSVFWRKTIWDKVQPFPAHMRVAGDYWLWIQMAKHTTLWSLNKPLSMFRKRKGQLSSNSPRYQTEQQSVRCDTRFSTPLIRIYFSLQSRIERYYPHFEPIFLLIYRVLFLRPNDRYIEIINNKPIIMRFDSYRTMNAVDES
jgi:glycosyltransferase involved in cell wall biosynthesis